MESLSAFHFVRPGWLYALFALAPLIWIGLRRGRAAGAWRRVCDAHLLEHVMTQPGGRARQWPLLLLALGWIATCFALAGPAWEQLPQPAFEAPQQRVLALNLSPSMDAADVAPSRLTRARYEMEDALALLGDGQAGLVIFAEEPYVVAPISDDPRVVASFLPVLETSLMPGRGTRVDRAIDEARALLEQAGATAGEIVLLTDGLGDRPDAALASARNAARAGYPVSVLAIGTEEGAPLPTRRGFTRDGRGQVVMSKLDLAALEALADAGEGRLATLDPGDEDVRSVLNLDTVLPGSDREIVESQHQVDIWKDQGIWLVWAAALLAPPAFRRGWATALGVVGLLAVGTLTPPTTQAGVREWMATPDQRGREAFGDGRHEEAAALFEDPAWRAASLYRNGRFEEAAEALVSDETTEGRYNLANALAKSGRLEEAIAAYDDTLETHPEHEDARHNRELVAKLLEQRDQQAQQAEGQGEPKQDGSVGDEGGNEPQGGDSSGGSQDPSGSNDGAGNDAAGGSEDRGSEGRGDTSQGSATGDDEARGSENGASGTNHSAGGSPDDPSAADPEAGGADPGAAGGSSTLASDEGAEPDGGDPGSAQTSAAASEFASHEDGAPNSSASELAPNEARPSATAGERSGSSPPASSMASQPLSEREQAVEQWLNRVSDDPGGLLREKLRRHYARKHHERQQRGVIR